MLRQSDMTWPSFRSRAVLVLLAGVCPLLSCAGAGPARWTRQPVPVRPPAPSPAVFRAGAAEIDITPPPGLPVFGSSTEAQPRLTGYRMRLYTRAIALEDAAGERFVLVQADLGSISGLLHREVAARTADLGLGPDRILIAATHTHGAPGGYFGTGFYNRFASSRSGFDPEVLEWLASRIVRAIRGAFAELAPARVGAVEVPVPGISRNRSRDAWVRNFTDGPPAGRDEIDRTLRLLRIDRVDGSGSRPMAAFLSFAVHGTAASIHQKLTHGDLQAVAAEVLRTRVLRSYGGGFFLDRFVPAVVNGAEGDVSPDYREQSFAEADRIGTALAEAAFSAFRSLDGALTEVELRHAYREVRLPNEETSDGPDGALCDRAVVGLPVLGGAEDGRSRFYGKLGIREGAPRKPPRGCQQEKRTALGFLQGLLLKPADFPRLGPFQMLRLGTTMTIVTVPGEPTTETGRAIREAVQRAGPAGIVAVVGLSDEYVGYWATRAEYAVQDYEGGSTLYGPHESTLARDQAGRLASATSASTAAASQFEPDREFFPSAPKSLWGTRGPCRSDAWRAVRVRRTGAGVSFDWKGLARDENCDAVPRVSVECGDRPLAIDGIPVDDRGLDFEVSRSGKRDWTAKWLPRAPVPAATCRFRVDRPAGGPLLSESFEPPAPRP